MKVIAGELPGILLFQPPFYSDDRGYFVELWKSDRYTDFGDLPPFVQDNVSRSKKGVLRGLHFQSPMPQGKLAMALEGEIFDVAVDLRPESKTLGKWSGVLLSQSNGMQIYVPPGFAHGIQVLSETALFLYKVTQPYQPQFQKTIRWNDPDLAIKWPIPSPVLSERDQCGEFLRNIGPKQGAGPIDLPRA